MATAQELVEQGIRAYVEGRLDDARSLLEEALQVDPGSSRARSYLLLLPGGLGASSSPRPSRTTAAVGAPTPAPRSTPVAYPAGPSSPISFAGQSLTPVPGATAPAPEASDEITREQPLRAAARVAAAPAIGAPGEVTAEQPIGAADEPTEERPLGPWAGLTGERPIDVPVEITGEHPLEAESAPPAPGTVEAPPTADYAPSPWDDGPASAHSIFLGSDGGLDLTAVAEKSDLRPLVPRAGRPSTPQEDVAVWMTAAKDLLALGDFSGSLEMIEKILKVDPEHAEARDYLSQNESTLVAMYESKLGPLGKVPRLAIKPEEIMWLNLDHRAGFLLSQIDGMVDYENLFALSGLPRLDTARILAALLADDVITA